MQSVLPFRDARLNLHEPRSPAVDDTSAQFPIEEMAGSPFFIRVSKRTKPVELHFFNKRAEFLELVFSLSGITGNHRGSHRNAGHLIANVPNQSLQALGTPTTFHGSQDAAIGMLQGHVHVLTDFGHLTHRCEERVVNLLWETI